MVGGWSSGRREEAGCSGRENLPKMNTNSRQSPLNVVLLVSDQHRRDACGCFGSRVRRKDGGTPTPHIDALAARGLAFNRAICSSPLCAPSRASYITGLYPHTTTALYHKMLDREAGLSRYPGVRGDVRTVADHFRAAGHRTAAIGKMHVHGEEAEGWDLGFDVRELRFYTQAPGMHYGDLAEGDTNRRYRQLPPYDGKTYAEVDAKRFAQAPFGLKVGDNTTNAHRLETLVEREEEMFDHLVATRSMAFIDDCCAADQPFFLHVGLEKPHEPWSVSQRYLDLFDPDQMPFPAAFDDWKERGRYPGLLSWQHAEVDLGTARNIMAAYYACVAALDDQVGRVVNHCRAWGILDRTVFVYASDHGELLFDHGLIYKHNFFESSVGVPLIVAGPGLTRGKTSDAPASLLDLMPTVLDLAGLAANAAAEGVSLVAAGRGEEDQDRILFSEFHQAGSEVWGRRMHPTRMARWRDFKYIYTHGLREQLFDLGRDPDELNDLAFGPGHKDVIHKLRHACLRDWELDAHPPMALSGWRNAGEVVLNWESIGSGATYSVWHEPLEGGPVPVASELRQTSLTFSAAPGSDRYRVVGLPALVRTFTDRDGLSLYGAEPVQTEDYPVCLPVSPLLVLNGQTETVKAEYRPWHGITFEGQDWIYEGMPPMVEQGVWGGSGPVAIVSARPGSGALTIGMRDLEFVGAEEGEESEESTVGLVFSWLSHESYWGLSIHSGGKCRLYHRDGPHLDVVAEASGRAAGVPVDLRLAVGERTVEVTAGGEVLIRWRQPEAFVPGRTGYWVGLQVDRFSFRSFYGIGAGEEEIKMENSADSGKVVGCDAK